MCQSFHRVAVRLWGLLFVALICTSVDGIANPSPESANVSTLKKSSAPLLPDTFLKVDVPQGAGAVCGRYLLPGSAASGYALHVFPDGVAMIENYSDISESQLVAAGQWSFENGLLTINWKQWSSIDEFILKRLSKKGGAVELLALYRRTRDRSASWFVLVPADEQPASKESYPVRVDDYLDWPAFKAKLTEMSRTGQTVR